MHLCEIIIYVDDMNAQVAFYRDIIGLEIEHPAGLADYGGQHWVAFRTGDCALCLHGGGKKRFGEDAPKFVFECDDIEAKRAALIERGVAMEQVFQAARGVLVCNGRDPEGNAFSLEARKRM